jgi:2-polyprenyl-3-methyl-5-hydroxy-6-metoxy-1,4-benzoquinol methylase
VAQVKNRYDNTAYWRGLHESYPGELRAVGHPTLSEAANRLKYQSEAETLARSFELAVESFLGRAEFQVLDIGAGNGFWTVLLKEMLLAQGIHARLAALDISRNALQSIASKLKDVELIEADLKRDAPRQHECQFDLVTAMYCLHHLSRLEEFLNGLRYAALCVRPGGCLMIMDPVLRDGYSPFHGVDESTWAGNGMPRSLVAIDTELGHLGFRRLSAVPAVSFILNGPIEARGKVAFSVKQTLWSLAGRVFRHEGLTRIVSPAFRMMDAVLKKTSASGSSSLCVYRKSI